MNATAPHPRRLQLAADRPFREGLIAALEQILAVATSHAETAAADPATAVHQHRKALRRARAVIRLARPLLSRRSMHRLDVSLKEAHRSQSNARDAGVLEHALSIAGEPAEQTGELGGALEAHRRRELDDQRIAAALAASVEAIRDIPARFAQALPEEVELDDLLRGLRRSYRRARAELARVETVADPFHIHNWRKRNKDVTYQLELLAPVLGARAAKRRERHADLSQQLGEVTDLFVLRRFIEQLDPSVAQRDELLARIDRLADKKLSDALDDGAPLFSRRPKKLVARLR